MAGVSEREQLPVSQARNGDADAWNVLFQRYRLPLFVYVFESVRNEQAAFDIVQETMISAIRHIGSLRDDGKFASWLFGIAHQKCIQLWRKSEREQVAFDGLEDDMAQFEPDPREMLVREEQKRDFLNLLADVPTAQRSVIVLFFLDELSLEEIAASTGVSIGTVKSRLHYGKKALKRLWKERGI